MYADFIQGGPAWLKSDSYRINAKAEGNPAPREIQGPMLQALLEDRFKLKVHRETREVPGFALTVTRGGPKMPSVAEGSCIAIPDTPFKEPPPIEKLCGPQPQPFKDGPNRSFFVHGQTLGEFSTFLSGITGKPVIDHTNVKGRFDYRLDFMPDASTTPGFAARLEQLTPADPTGGTSLFTALQEQLGLKLDAAKAPREYMVIDRVERPSEN
jgi:uncharacterized protein (TIGR03435 family)